MDYFHFIESNSFSSINRIQFISDERISCVKKILSKVEIVEFLYCKLDGEFHEKILQFCTHMKRLTVRALGNVGSNGIVIGINNDWMLRQYEMLEQFEMTQWTSRFSNERKMETFLERNPKI